MSRLFLCFPAVAGDFDFMDSSGPGAYYGLWKKLSETGAGAYYFERHLGVWLILLAVGLLFLSWTFRSSSVQERIHIKDRTITIIIVVALFFGVAGLITTVIQAGFDY